MYKWIRIVISCVKLNGPITIVLHTDNPEASGDVDVYIRTACTYRCVQADFQNDLYTVFAKNPLARTQ